MSEQQTRADRRVALVTCSEYRNGHPDDRTLVAPLAALGVEAAFVAWDDPVAEWSAFDLVVLRSTWDYTSRRDEFLAWADSVENLCNPAGAVRWSSDKCYLGELAAREVPCVPTEFLDPGAADDDVRATIGRVASTSARFVVKPSVGAGSVDAGRFESGDRSDLDQGCKHASMLLDSGRTAMVQPYLAGIDTDGESSLIFLDDVLSHAVRKEPLLIGGPVAVDGLFVEEKISALEPTIAQVAMANAVLDAAPFDRRELLYARVDVLPGPAGPLLLELELVEPSLFIEAAAGSAAAFASAIARRLVS